MTSLLELRIQVAEARANMRSARDAYELAKAEAEQRAIDAGITGKNEAERTRNFMLALARDTRYQTALRQYRQAEAAVDQAEAYLEAARDDRRNQEWQIRAHLIEALHSTGIASDSRDIGGDSAFDDIFQSATDHAMHASVLAHR